MESKIIGQKDVFKYVLSNVTPSTMGGKDTCKRIASSIKYLYLAQKGQYSESYYKVDEGSGTISMEFEEDADEIIKAIKDVMGLNVVKMVVAITTTSNVVEEEWP